MNDGGDRRECACRTLHASKTFRGWNDYDELVASLAERDAFTEVPVKRPYSNVGLVERWFRCAKCDAVWRLIEPDPPFAGTWERVAS